MIENMLRQMIRRSHPRFWALAWFGYRLRAVVVVKQDRNGCGSGPMPEPTQIQKLSGENNFIIASVPIPLCRPGAEQT
jgi:hypothetical protein